MDKTTYSALQKKQVTIPAYSVTTIDYIDTQPNYFRVQNNGEAKLYCSTAHIPTEQRYDFAVPAAGMKMFGEPFDRAKLYIYNPSGNSVNATILSFKAGFDPLVLAMSDIEIDLSGSTIEADNVIKSFETSLPAGSNIIGKVGLSEPIPAGNNVIGTVVLESVISDALTALKNGQKNYSSVLADILEAIGNVSVGGEGGGNLVFHSIEGTATGSAEDIIDMVGGVNVKKVHYISNDGESSITVSMKSASGSLVAMTVKAGEVINDISGNFDMLMLTGNDVAYRLAVSC